MDPSESRFKILDLLVKGVLGAVITLAIGILGYQAEKTRQEIAAANEQIQESNREMNALIKFASEQKDLDINLGMRMFETLMKDYLRMDDSQEGATEKARKNILLVRLIALNFQDVPINLKPLFEQLDGQLITEQDRAELRKAAMEVGRRQAFRLTFETNLDTGEKSIKAGEEISLPSLEKDFRIQIDKIARDRVEAHFIILADEKGTYPERKIPFALTYFDMPIVDNVIVPSERRASLLLLGTSGEEAKVRLIAFPKDLAADRFDIKEITRKFRETMVRNKQN